MGQRLQSKSSKNSEVKVLLEGKAGLSAGIALSSSEITSASESEDPDAGRLAGSEHADPFAGATFGFESAETSA